jgi:hypothetical protein
MDIPTQLLLAPITLAVSYATTWAFCHLWSDISSAIHKRHFPSFLHSIRWSDETIRQVRADMWRRESHLLIFIK